MSASSPLTPSLSFSATGLPPGLSINAASGIISGTITDGDSLTGSYNVAVTVNDGTITRTGQITWAISNAISISAPAEVDNTDGDTVNLPPIVATTTANRPVTLSVTGLPPGLLFDPATGIVSGVISGGASVNAPYQVMVQATDGIDTASTSFIWNIANTGITFDGLADQVNLEGDPVDLAPSVRRAVRASLCR